MIEQKFNLEFTFAEINLVLKACRKLPYEETVNTINSIINQYEVIIKAKEAKANKEKEAVKK